jgi:hypothetical protein
MAKGKQSKLLPFTHSADTQNRQHHTCSDSVAVTLSAFFSFRCFFFDLLPLQMENKQNVYNV